MFEYLAQLIDGFFIFVLRAHVHLGHYDEERYFQEET